MASNLATTINCEILDNKNSPFLTVNSSHKYPYIFTPISHKALTIPQTSPKN